jgi:oxaloacetate decarboxylase (Na+ extruding) subunit alpha
VNIKEIKEMLALMSENNLVELEIEKDGTKIRLKKSNPGGDQFTGPYVIEREKAGPAGGRSVESVPAPAAEKPVVKTLEIKAPMVGTFYRAPSPEAPPYAEAGQVVEPGQVVCIIEAMKLMNEIKSEIRGRVVEVLVENAEPVEYGQSMFIIEPL